VDSDELAGVCIQAVRFLHEQGNVGMLRLPQDCPKDKLQQEAGALSGVSRALSISRRHNSHAREAELKSLE
jgi:hypothetical protein